MSDNLRVRWTITSLSLPKPWIACSRCSEIRPFRCSGKFRLNANGKRLDAWLIYRCGGCDQTWNRPLFERRKRSEVDPAMLEALQANDHGLARRFALDIAGLRAFTNRIEGMDDAAICKEVVSSPAAQASCLEIVLVVSGATTARLDRVLAGGLGLSRNRIDALLGEGRLEVVPGGGKALRRPPRDGQRILLDLADEAPAMCVVAAT